MPMKTQNLRPRSGLKRLLCATVCLLPLVLAACESRVGTRGNLPDPDLIESLEMGISGRDEVTQMLGSPSSVAIFDFETWFYISERTETTAFFEPEVVDRKILIVKFDKQGTLASLSGFGLEASHNVEPVERTTPTAGNDVTVLDQILGNLGRFNKAGGSGL